MAEIINSIMDIDHIEINKIIELLKKNKSVADIELKRAQEVSKRTKISLLSYLLSERIITRDLLGKTFAEYYKVPYFDLNAMSPGREQVQRIPEDFAKKYHMVLVREDEKNCTISTDNPDESGIGDVLKKIFGRKNLRFVYSFKTEIENTFIHYRKNLETRFVKILKESKSVAPEILEEIFEDALAYKASDIHFEPQDQQLTIRFRIDGVLQEVGRLEKKQYENILNRIKVQAHLRTDEHFSAQDGAIRYAKDGQSADVRVSIIPILDGEKVVMRILSQYVSGLNLADLGFSAFDEDTLTKASEKPFGMILVTGPTGSGKTTTLYALLRLLNQPEVNITTIEDPVEYKMTGVNHIQVNPQTNLTFAEGLRSIVRQDPDIILVGEIRDEETAQIAVNAALTGHLLLSTFHANDAATAIPRLLDMEVEPFLLASTLEVVVAQRLARRICQNCRKPEKIDDGMLKTYNLHEYKQELIAKNVQLFRGEGCNACGESGYKGRIGLYEFIRNTPTMEELILRNPSSREIWQLAKSEGAHSLFEDGLEKVKKGMTTLDELLRVATPPKY
jgi:type II secretory ATPase GspE/PulE/Tfp pilus assembly ATPase PilB-like protein